LLGSDPADRRIAPSGHRALLPSSQTEPDRLHDKPAQALKVMILDISALHFPVRRFSMDEAEECPWPAP
jgi:hypothetical protein